MIGCDTLIVSWSIVGGAVGKGHSSTACAAAYWVPPAVSQHVACDPWYICICDPYIHNIIHSQSSPIRSPPQALICWPKLLMMFEKMRVWGRSLHLWALESNWQLENVKPWVEYAMVVSPLSHSSAGSRTTISASFSGSLSSICWRSGGTREKPHLWSVRSTPGQRFTSLKANHITYHGK